MQAVKLCALYEEFIFFLVLQSGKAPVKDLFTDLKDGRKLLDLLEGLTGTSLVSN